MQRAGSCTWMPQARDDLIQERDEKNAMERLVAASQTDASENETWTIKKKKKESEKEGEEVESAASLSAAAVSVNAVVSKRRLRPVPKVPHERDEINVGKETYDTISSTDFLCCVNEEVGSS